MVVGLWQVGDVVVGLWQVGDVVVGLWQVGDVIAGLWQVGDVIAGLWQVGDVVVVCGRLVIRIMPPDDTKSLRPLGMKFGCDPSDAGHLLRIAKELDLNVIGVRYRGQAGMSYL